MARRVTQAMICAAEDAILQAPQAEYDTEFGFVGDLAWKVSRFRAGTGATSLAHKGHRLLIVLKGTMRIVLNGEVQVMHGGDFVEAGPGKTIIYCETDVEAIGVHAAHEATTPEELHELVIRDEPLYRQLLGIPSGMLAKE